MGPVGSGNMAGGALGATHRAIEGTSGTASGAATAGSSHPMSSAAFLHHLHTDPSSHHISLAAPPGSATPTRSRTSSEAGLGKVKVLSQAPSTAGSPKNLQMPLEPTVAEVRSKAASAPIGTSDMPATAGPSMIKRQLSKRGRPSTAPTPMRSPGEGPPSPSNEYGTNQSPGLDLDPIASGNSPFIPPQPTSDPALGCSAVPSAGLAEAVDMMSIADNYSSPPTRVLGRAGPTTSDGRSGRREDLITLPSPPPQLSWHAFGLSYAHGLFDSNKIPNPPLSDLAARESRSAHYNVSAGSSPSHRPSVLMAGGSSSGSGGLHSTDSEDSGTTMTSTSSAPVSSIGSSAPRTGMAAALAARKKALELESLQRNSDNQAPLRPDQLRLPSYSMAAATVRMVASGYQQSDFSPLAVPSPERELTDPLASFVPGSGSTLRAESASSDPGSRNPLSRSMSSAVVGRTELPTILASPAATPMEHPRHRGMNLLAAPKPEPTRIASSPGALGKTGLGGIVANQRIPPATAPIEKTLAEEDDGDYFGASAVPRFDRHQSTTSYTSQSSSNQTVTNATSTPMVRSKSSEDHPPTPPPALPRAQSSTEHPRRKSGSPGSDDVPPALAYAGDVGALYEKFGWLPAPVPPNESARRKALYRYNILHTSADVNFDRIAHMAKLVFNTKIVLIALIDGEDQWHKSQTGLGVTDAKRISSFCSHTLLVT